MDEENRSESQELASNKNLSSSVYLPGVNLSVLSWYWKFWQKQKKQTKTQQLNPALYLV